MTIVVAPRSSFLFQFVAADTALMTSLLAFSLGLSA